MHGNAYLSGGAVVSGAEPLRAFWLARIAAGDD